MDHLGCHDALRYSPRLRAREQVGAKGASEKRGANGERHQRTDERVDPVQCKAYGEQCQCPADSFSRWEAHRPLLQHVRHQRHEHETTEHELQHRSAPERPDLRRRRRPCHPHRRKRTGAQHVDPPKARPNVSIFVSRTSPQLRPKQRAFMRILCVVCGSQLYFPACMQTNVVGVVAPPARRTGTYRRRRPGSAAVTRTQGLRDGD